MTIYNPCSCCPSYSCCNNNPFQVCNGYSSVVTTLVVTNLLFCQVNFCLTLSDGTNVSVSIPGNPTGTAGTTTIGPYPNNTTITFLKASICSPCSVNLLYCNTIPQLGVTVNVSISSTGVFTFTA